MRLKTLVTILAVTLAACGRGGGSVAPAAQSPAETGGVCALLTDAAAVFGANAEAVNQTGFEGMEGTCQFNSADGARSGELITYATPAAFDELVQKWDAMTETPLAPVAGVGDAAQIATDLPGYQTQIVVRKGQRVFAILAGSGDGAMSGDQIARAMAAQVASAP